MSRDSLNGRTAAIVEGRWALVDGYIGAVRVPEAELSQLTMTIENGRFHLGSTEGLILVDSSSRPAAIDIIPTSGPNRGRFVPGIFERSHEALLICYDLSGASRPTTFDAPPGTRFFTALYKHTPIDE